MRRHCEFGMAAMECGHDTANQFPIGKPVETRDENKIGSLRIESGERIDLKELRLPGARTPHIDAAAVAAAQGTPCGKSDVAGFPRFAILRQPVFDSILKMLLVLITIAVRRGFFV